MSLLDTINANYKIQKQPLQTRGLQDSNYWDGLWIRPYVQEYLEDGTINPEFKDFREKPFSERGYYFLGHGNGLSFNVSAENTEVVVDSTKEKIYLKGSSGLEITVEIVNKFSKLLAKLGVTGMLLNKPKQVNNLFLGSIETESVDIEEEDYNTIHTIPISIEALTINELDNLKFFYGAKEVSLERVLDPKDLEVGAYFVDIKENVVLVHLDELEQEIGTLAVKYTGGIDEVLVGYGGESKENNFFNVVQIYNDQQTGKVSYREAFKCVVDPSRTIAFRGQNATDGGSTASLKFNASEDVTRPAGEQLFIEKDDWDNSLVD